MSFSPLNQIIIKDSVALSLKEDIGIGDISAALIPPEKLALAKIISRQKAFICGVLWATEVYQQLDSSIQLDWKIKDGDLVEENQVLVEIKGPARALLTGERCVLNWLQTLSGTTTITHQYLTQLSGTQVKLLDTRKTIPGLRYAQKYAVYCAGAQNHRFGLYDAFLIKENHIISCGSIANAIAQAKAQNLNKKIEVEVENLDELAQALQAKADIIMLDNFSFEQMREAVVINQRQAKLEVSGNIAISQIAEIAAIGIDYISVGALTKNINAIDLSMRFKT